MEPEFVGYEPEPDEIKHHDIISQWRSGIRVWAKDNKEQSLMQEAMVSDRLALRFLVARDMVVEDAVTMFKECLDLRKNKNLDHILDEIKPVHRRIAMLLPLMFHGYAKNGCPILIEHTGHNRLAQAIEETSLEDVLEFHLIFQEFTMRKVLGAASKRINKRVDSRYYLADLTGGSFDSMTKVTRTYLKHISAEDAVLYPESLLESWVLNAGMVFSVCYAVVKPFLPARTITKFKIFRSYPANDFERDFGLEILPSYMGGKYKGNFIIDYSREEGTRIYPAIYNEDELIWPSQVDPFGEKAAEELASRAMANGTKIKVQKVKVDKCDRNFTDARMCAPWTEEFFYLIEHGLAAYEAKYEPEKAKIRATMGDLAFAPECLLEEDPDSMTAGVSLSNSNVSAAKISANPSTLSVGITQSNTKTPMSSPLNTKPTNTLVIENTGDSDDEEDHFVDAVDISNPDFDILCQEAEQLQRNA